MRVFVIAGEPSGDRLGAAVMEGLASIAPRIRFEGVGGPLMEARGLASLFPMEELSVMGIAEILPKYPALRRRMIETAEAVLDARPDILLTIDSPDFCLRVAKRVRRRARIRTVHYVAPSVWAWRPGRARKMAPHVDQVLALLPFEPPYMEAAGMRCDFVGHPVVADPRADPATTERLRREAGGGPIVTVLPGSRRSEVDRLLPVFGAALRQLRRHNSDIRVLLPCVPHLFDEIAAATEDWPGTNILNGANVETKRAAFAAADVALAASGTVSLELAHERTPMVIAYDVNRLTWQIMRRMALVDTVTLVNLVVGERIVPEFLGPDCQPTAIAAALGAILAAPGLQRQALDATMSALGEGGAPPGFRAARAILEGLAEDRGR